jgi:hypothetical protein
MMVTFWGKKQKTTMNNSATVEVSGDKTLRDGIVERWKGDGE